MTFLHICFARFHFALTKFSAWQESLFNQTYFAVVGRISSPSRTLSGNCLCVCVSFVWANVFGHFVLHTYFLAAEYDAIK